VVSPAGLQAHSASALVYVAQALGGSGWSKVMALGGSGWSKVMALALALSVIATTGTAIVLTARIVYGMASYRTHVYPGRQTVSERLPASAAVDGDCCSLGYPVARQLCRAIAGQGD